MRLTSTPIVVEIEDAKFYFAEPTHKDYQAIVALAKEPLDKQIEFAFSKLRKVQNFQDEDGTEFSVERLREIEIPRLFALQIFNGWISKLGRALGFSSGAEEKKEQEEPNSSDSSNQVSTTQDSTAETAGSSS